MDDFARVNAGTRSPSESFAPEDVNAMLANAERVTELSLVA
jgi:hypothetical protein